MNEKIPEISFHKRDIESISIGEDRGNDEDGLYFTYHVKISIDIDHEKSPALIKSLEQFFLSRGVFTLNYLIEDDFIERVEVDSPLSIEKHQISSSFEGMISTFDIISEPLLLDYRGANIVSKQRAK